MNMPSAKEIVAFLQTLPGKRGTDIPADIFDKIQPVAHGISMQVWGSGPTPEQLQHLHDQGIHEPGQIHEAFGGLPHPHSPSLSVAEYQRFAEAKSLFDTHQRTQRR